MLRFLNLKFIYLLIVLTPLLKTSEALEQSGGTVPPSSGGTVPGATLENPLGSTSIAEILNKIINFLLIISVPILAIMILIGGFYILTAGGSAEKAKTGRMVIVYAAIGFIIILASKGVGLILLEILK